MQKFHALKRRFFDIIKICFIVSINLKKKKSNSFLLLKYLIKTVMDIFHFAMNCFENYAKEKSERD
jgi:hypothetical protein